MGKKDKFFIVYANNSLRKKPENFIKIIDFLEDEGDIHIEDQGCFKHDENITASSLLRGLAELIIYLGLDEKEACIKRGKERAALSKREKLSLNKEAYFIEGQSSLTFDKIAEFDGSIIIDGWREAAFEAAYGYLDDYCWQEDEDAGRYRPCWPPGGLPFNQIIDFSLYSGLERLRCFECYQVCFAKVLDRIAAGDKLKDIPGLIDLLKLGQAWVTSKVVLDENGLVLQAVAKTLFDPEGHLVRGPDLEFPFKHVFNEFLMALVANSLGAFLYANGNPKDGGGYLKRCDRCGDFFYNLRKDKPDSPGRFCSTKCRQNWHNVKNQPRNAAFKRDRIEKLGIKDIPPSYLGGDRLKS